MAFKLHPKRDPGWEIVRVVETLVAQTGRNVANGDVSSAERIHRARTACKQMRAALKLIRSSDKKRYRRDNRWLRDTARGLAGLRDAEANVFSFEALCDRLKEPEKRLLLEPVRLALRKRREVLAAPGPALDRRLAAVGARLERFEGRLEDWRPEIDFAAIAKNFGQTYATARSAWRTAWQQQTAESFHAWRKATKACGYQCRLLRSASTPALKRLREGLTALARQLGDEHDLTVLSTQLEKYWRSHHGGVGPVSVRAAMNLVEARRAALRGSTLILGKRVFGARSAEVAAQLEQAWRVARERPSDS